MLPCLFAKTIQAASCPDKLGSVTIDALLDIV